MIQTGKGLTLRRSIETREWCATICDNRQILSIAGVGKDPLSALSDLYLNVQTASLEPKRQTLSLGDDCDYFLCDYHRALTNIIDGFSGVEIFKRGEEQLVYHMPYSYKGTWDIRSVYSQWDSVRCDGVRYFWANPRPGNSTPPARDWDAI